MTYCFVYIVHTLKILIWDVFILRIYHSESFLIVDKVEGVESFIARIFSRRVLPDLPHAIYNFRGILNKIPWFTQVFVITDFENVENLIVLVTHILFDTQTSTNS